MSADPAQRVVHRSVQARVSRQYQRTSAQALPPSAIILPTDKRMPHSQQDSATPGPERAGVQ
jgi:hypothetical protein